MLHFESRDYNVMFLNYVLLSHWSSRNLRHFLGTFHRMIRLQPSSRPILSLQLVTSFCFTIFTCCKVVLPQFSLCFIYLKRVQVQNPVKSSRAQSSTAEHFRVEHIYFDTKNGYNIYIILPLCDIYFDSIRVVFIQSIKSK